LEYIADLDALTVIARLLLHKKTLKVQKILILVFTSMGAAGIICSLSR
jgi:hypothetical protein